MWTISRATTTSTAIRQGDLALRAIAAALVTAARSSDGLYRYGGEEFLLILPKQSQLGAKAFMERALDTVRGLEIAHSGDPTGHLTLSTGISAFTAGHRADADTLLGEADVALYAAKAPGRSRVELAL